MAQHLLKNNLVIFGQREGTVLENLSIKAGGEALTQEKPTVLSCGGISVSHRTIPSTPLHWKDIINMPGAEMGNRLFGLEAVPYQWNPYLEEAIYAN